MLLECFEEQLVIFGIWVTRVVDVVVRRVDTWWGELQPVLKQRTSNRLIQKTIIPNNTLTVNVIKMFDKATEVETNVKSCFLIDCY